MFIKIRNFISAIGNINENESLVKLRNNVGRPPALLFSKLGLSPTIFNLTGLLLGVISGVLVGLNVFPLAAVVFLLSSVSDLFDGAIARYRNIASDFGTFFDSVCDRYADVSILAGITWYYFSQGEKLLALLALVSILGTSVTSYAKARAESLSVTGRYVGLMNRPERVILLIIGLFYLHLLPAILWILAILSNVTALHRVAFYSYELRKRQRI